MRLLLIISILLLSARCTNNSQQTENDIPDAPVVSDDYTTETKYYAIVGDLRIRDKPSTEGNTLGNIPYGDHLYFLEEETSMEEEFTLRGEKRRSSWKKVRWESALGESTEGWVFGGGILEESEMFKEISPNVIEQKIVKANEKELANILAMDILNPGLYDGTILFTNSASGNLIKHGAFSLITKHQVEISSNFIADCEIQYTGGFTENRPDGDFIERDACYETITTTTLKFNQGKCISGKYHTTSEGEVEESEVDGLNECTFDFVALYHYGID